MTGSDRRVDRHIGARLRQRRLLLGLKQEDLADAIGVSFQQLQKYETGTNRISGGRLYALARRLEVQVGYFFEGIGEVDQFRGEDRASPSASLLPQREVLEMIRVYSVLKPDIRKSLMQHMRALARSEEPAECNPPDGGTA